MPETTLKDLRPGTECWAWQYDWPRGMSLPVSSMKPVRGVLAAQSDRIGDASGSMGWFVPYSGKSRRPAFTKAVRIEAVNICSDRDEAEDKYNKTVRATASRFHDLALMAEMDVVKLSRDGFADGNIEDYPVLRADMTFDYKSVISAFGASLELKPDHGGTLMSWADFLEADRTGCLTWRDGYGDVIIDGLGSEHALLDIARGLVYIPDSFAIPFHRMAEVFKDREIQVIWFNK